MAKGFELFLKQYHSQGREKLEGYTLTNLDELTLDEHAQAIRILQEEAPKFNGAYEPLVYLDPKLAVSTFKKIEEELPDNEYRAAYMVYYWLFKLTSSDSHAKNFCDSRKYLSEPKYSSSIIPFYAHASWIVDSPIVEEMLRSAIFTETHETGLSTAAGALLEKHGVSFENLETKEKHRELWKTLTKGTVEEKNAVLAQLTPSALTPNSYFPI